MENIRLKRVTPIDSYTLILELNNSEFRVFAPEKVRLYDKYPFLAHPNKLIAYTFTTDAITWFNNVSFDINFLYKYSKQIDFDTLIYKTLKVAFKNQPSTEEYNGYHVCEVFIRPFNMDKPFILSEAIGGGHDERGDFSKLSIVELLEYQDWKTHFEKSDCDWAIELILQFQHDIQKLLDLILIEICKRSNTD